MARVGTRDSDVAEYEEQWKNKNNVRSLCHEKYLVNVFLDVYFLGRHRQNWIVWFTATNQNQIYNQNQKLAV